MRDAPTVATSVLHTVSRNPAVPGSRPPQLAWAADDERLEGVRRRPLTGSWSGSGGILPSLASGPWIRLSCRPEKPGLQQERNNATLCVGTLLPGLVQGGFQSRWLWIPQIHAGALMKNPRPCDPAPSRPK